MIQARSVILYQIELAIPADVLSRSRISNLNSYSPDTALWETTGPNRRAAGSFELDLRAAELPRRIRRPLRICVQGILVPSRLGCILAWPQEFYTGNELEIRHRLNRFPRRSRDLEVTTLPALNHLGL